MAKYIGEKEVSEINGTEVKFTDGTTKSFSEKALTYIVTDESKDPTAYQSLIIDNVCPDIFTVLQEHDITRGQVGPVLNAVTYSINETFTIAIGKAFGTYEKNIHAAYFPENVKMSDLHRVSNI